MAYGIDEQIRAGVPADFFPRQVTYYQVGSGKLHAHRSCADKRGSSHAIHVDVTSVPSNQMCSRCAKAATTTAGLHETICAADVYRQALELLRELKDNPASLDWTVVARATGLHISTHVIEWPDAQPRTKLVNQMRADLRELIARGRDTLSVDVGLWCDAAIFDVVALNEPLDDDLVEERKNLQLAPSAKYGPRDGYWQQTKVRHTVRNALEAGLDWDTARAAGHTELDVWLNLGDRDDAKPDDADLRRIHEVYDDIVTFWQATVAEHRTVHYGPDPEREVVIVARPQAYVARGSSSVSRYRNLVVRARAAVETADGALLVAVVPSAVAAVLAEDNSFNGYGNATLEIAGDAGEPGTATVETLELVVRLMTGDVNLAASDALTAALGVLDAAA